jgi:hypothetical protein
MKNIINDLKPQTTREQFMDAMLDKLSTTLDIPAAILTEDTDILDGCNALKNLMKNIIC